MHKVPTALLEAVTEPRTARLCSRQTPRPPAPWPPMELSVAECPRTQLSEDRLSCSPFSARDWASVPAARGRRVVSTLSNSLRKIKGKMASCDMTFTVQCSRNKVLLEGSHPHSQTSGLWLTLPYGVWVELFQRGPQSRKYLLGGPLRKPFRDGSLLSPQGPWIAL